MESRYIHPVLGYDWSDMMKRYIRCTAYHWSDGTVIQSNLPKNVFAEKYYNLRYLKALLQQCDSKNDVCNQLLSAIDDALSVEPFTGELNLDKSEKLLLYVLRKFGSAKTKSIIQQISNYSPRLIRVSEDTYNYCGWTIQISESEDYNESAWACISPDGDWDFSADSLSDAKRSVDSVLRDDFLS